MDTPGQTQNNPFLYEQIACEMAELIRQGTFPAGERIPSVRQLSRQHKISISTALQAYRLLEDQGLIEARPQSGYYVRERLTGQHEEVEISAPAPDPTRVGSRELVMMILRDTANPDLIQLGTAFPNPDLVANDKLSRIMVSIARQARREHGLYDIPPGNETLRTQIAQRSVLSGCYLAPADIVTTSGIIEAYSLSLRAVCRPGDTVAIESPAYFANLQALEALDLRALEIPAHPRYGISLEALRFAIEHNPVHACLVNPNFSNPLGSCMPDDKKQELVEMLAAREIPLIEGDDSGELFFSGQRPTVCKAYDRKGLVLHCSSFSNVLSPGYRVGWIVPGRFKATVEWLKFTTNMATATLPQLVIAQFLSSGGYDHHLRSIRRVYAASISQMVHAVLKYFPEGTRVTHPDGGLVLWVQLPAAVDSLLLYKQALNAGITLAPGYIFSATDQYRSFIRLNAASWNFQAAQAVQRLGELVLEQTKLNQQPS
jgi:DNA-binding transcriptional MocR family regulator